MSEYIDIVFDGPPGPESGRFIEVEDSTGRSISLGEWVDRKDGFRALRINLSEFVRSVQFAKMEEELIKRTLCDIRMIMHYGSHE